MTQPHIPHVIGLTGPAGSGKDTVAELLRTHRDACVMAFADALRDEIVDAFCIEYSFLTHRETKEHLLKALALSRCLDREFVDRMSAFYLSGLRTSGILGDQIDLVAPRSPRQIMQWWGTEYRRVQHPNYWTQKASQKIHWFIDQWVAKLIVITDVRFPNEAALVRSMGGQIWQIKRPGNDVRSNAHISEVTGEAFDPDVVINNSHDMRHLQNLVLGAYALRAEIAA